MKEIEALLTEMRALHEAALRENARLSAESARLGRENDDACDRIFELEQRIAAMRAEMHERIAREAAPDFVVDLSDSIAISEAAKSSGVSLSQARMLVARLASLPSQQTERILKGAQLTSMHVREASNGVHG